MRVILDKCRFVLMCARNFSNGPRARSGIKDDADIWSKRFPAYEDWHTNRVSPTIKQLEEFARKTYTPIGYLLLDDPPLEDLPIPDFRTVQNDPVRNVSAGLLDTVYACQARQGWYRDHQLLNEEAPLPFVGTVSLGTSVAEGAQRMAEVLSWTSEARQALRSWDDALSLLREQAELAGALVMISGIVGSNTHRTLHPEEFRGFALSDAYASVAFVNGADSKAAQIFTLAHELAHIWLGETALSDLDPRSTDYYEQERWCNQVAAELLVPMNEFRLAIAPRTDLGAQLQPLARHFKVSTEVILRRMLEVEALNWDQFLNLISIERERSSASRAAPRPGGNYYNAKPVQIGKRFARELIASTIEGHTSYTEAFRLLSIRKTATFEGLGKQLGVL